MGCDHAQYLVVAPRQSHCPTTALVRLLDWHRTRQHNPHTALWTLEDGTVASTFWFTAAWLAIANVNIGVSSMRVGGAT
ncbi:hypothetical protein HDU86_005265 [Geranomyces michiganensis]|nr:hypothetical protein HDU86_005265 [Geranomyces michiganensis]